MSKRKNKKLNDFIAQQEPSSEAGEESRSVEVQLTKVHTQDHSRGRPDSKKESRRDARKEDAKKEESASAPPENKPSAHLRPKQIIVPLIIIALLTVVVVLAFMFFLQKSPLDKVVSKFRANYPDSLLSIQLVSGEQANSVAAQVRTVCTGFGLDEFYLAEIISARTGRSVLYVVNPITGATECTIDRALQPAASSVAPNLLATVNGEGVYSSDVLAVYNNVPETVRTNQSLQQAFDQVINNKLLVQEAKRMAIVVGDDEVDSALNSFLSTNQLTIEGVENALKQSNSSMEQFRAQIRDTLLLQKVILEVTKNVPAVSDEDVKAYYDANKDNLSTPPSSVTKQITVFANNSNAEEKLEIMRSIALKLNQTNFCELVSNYSEDTVTRDTCGVYSTRMGELLPEYEQAVYNASPGDRKLIATRVGFHIIEVVSLTPGKKLSFEESKPSIADFLNLLKKQEFLGSFIVGLRQKADIKSYVPNQ